MNREDDKEEEQLELTSDADDSWQQDETSFSSLDDEEDFDESDRDSDFATFYTEDEEEPEPDYFDDLPEDHPDEPAAESATWEEDAAAEEGDAWLELSLEPEEQPEEAAELDWVPDNYEQSEPEASSPDLNLFDDEEPAEAPPSTLPPIGTLHGSEPEMDLPADEEWEDDEQEYYEDEEQQEVSLPLGLILVGVIALVLLGAGGYGVMQQRAEMQEEVRQLRATLATAANPSDVADTRAASEALNQRNSELESQLQQLERENSNLKAIVSGLEQQLQAQQEVLSKPATKSTPPPQAIPEARPKPKPASEPTPKAAAKPSPKPVNPAPVATSSGSGWFVNFGSYSQRDTAESWARRLQPEAGKVIVMAGEKGGRTFYRVRVVELPSRAKANTIARSLEQKYGLSKLWIGQAG